MATALWKYFNPGAVKRRLPFVPGWLSVSAHAMRSARPLAEVITKKYDGDFEAIWSTWFARRALSLTKDEMYTLFASVRATRDLSGAIAEFGVYTGASARLICEARGDQELYLFDTFGGMPDAKIGAADRWPEGTHTATSIDGVRASLRGCSGVHFVAGVFPDSIEAHPDFDLPSQRFSFVHLDVDLYESTLEGLEFFYPRLEPFGRLVSHNYNISAVGGGDTPGVKAAFIEYFAGRESLIVEVADTQCVVVKPENASSSPVRGSPRARSSRSR